MALAARGDTDREQRRVPLFATRPALERLWPRIAERQRAVLESGRYVLGPELEAFEREFAAYVDRRHCVGVANGTDAITIALRALGVGPGDDVIVPGVSFFATAEAVVNAGARPVFADIDPETHCLTAATAEAALTPKTRALLPVHLFGNPAPLAELRELASAHGLHLVEDAAQAAGAGIDGRRAGAFGDAACFSFYPGKNLGAIGDAGAIVTDDEGVATRARTLRWHGQGDARWVHVAVGYNSRLDEIQAAALRVMLPQLDAWTRARRRAAAAYAAAGLGRLARLQRETPGGQSCHHLFVVQTADRDALAAGLAERGIESRAYYTLPLNRQPALAELGGARRRLPACEELARHGLALPMGQSLEPETAAAVTAAVAEVLGG
jgi:dTDP-3-amino-3,4,6-trideoxy-alpha-D-glucose transaminase